MPSLLSCVDLELLLHFHCVCPNLKQTQAVDPQIKTETKAEVTTENPEAVSTDAVSPGVGVKVFGSTPHPLPLSWIWKGIKGSSFSLGLTKHFFRLSVFFISLH